MKTAEEILKSHSGGDGDMWDCCIEAMKDYAREAIAEHLERAAESAVSWIQNPSDRRPVHKEIISTEIILK